MIWVSEATEKVAGTRPKVTSVAPVKPEPSIVTAVPPVTGPLEGETPVTLGAVRERAASVTTVWPWDREKVADRAPVRPRLEASLARDPVPPAQAGTRSAGTLAVLGAAVVCRARPGHELAGSVVSGRWAATVAGVDIAGARMEAATTAAPRPTTGQWNRWAQKNRPARRPTVAAGRVTGRTVHRAASASRANDARTRRAITGGTAARARSCGPSRPEWRPRTGCSNLPVAPVRPGRTEEDAVSEPTIRELAERHWQGGGDLEHEQHPVVPVVNRVTEEILDGVLYLKSVASVTAIDSGDGLVFLDTGGPFDANVVFDGVRRWRPDDPMAVAVFSHHHIDHVFGTARFESEAQERGWARPEVYGHELMASHFDRYQRTLGWNTAINKRQFGLPIDTFSWPADFRRPDVTYRDTLSVTRGDLTLELHHARGETDDATWTWIPERRLLHPGDLFIYCVPNAGNPQKVQRYLSDWAAALREMAGLGAEVMVAGHGLPIFGADRIETALRDTAELLDAIEDQTLVAHEPGLHRSTGSSTR